jgi:hypothetical protein
MQFQAYNIFAIKYEEVNTFFCDNTSRDQDGGRIILGHNADSMVVMLRPIRFLYREAWNSPGLPCIYV